MRETRLFLLFLLGYARAELPPFIKPCSKSNPWFQFCIMNQIPTVMQALTSGYPQLGFRPIDPFVLSEVEVPFMNKIHFSIKNLQVRGLSKAKFEFLMVDPYRGLVEVRIKFPQINMQGFYRMKGWLLFKEVDTQGPAAITFGDTVVEAKIQFQMVERGGQLYYEMPIRPIPGRDMDVEMAKANLYFGNLVPENQATNEKLNDLLRSNFFSVFDKIKPGIVSVMWQIAYMVTSPLLAQTTVDEMFSE